MADKGWRRSGFSRRAPIGAFVGLVLSVLAIVVGGVLLVRSGLGNDVVSGERRVGLAVTAPIAGAIRAPCIRAAAGRDITDDNFRAVSGNRGLQSHLVAALPTPAPA